MRTLLATFTALAVCLITQPAWACGGCFGPPPPPQAPQNFAVLQNAERVLFVRDPNTKKSTVWVEVRYAGLAEGFGWVLPLPKQPKVGVGTVKVFDALDKAMAFRVSGVGRAIGRGKLQQSGDRLCQLQLPGDGR